MLFMKKFFISLLVIFFGISVIGQPLTKEDYLRKSKNQKTWAWVLTGGGIATAIGGIVITTSNISYFPGETVGPILIAAGGAAIGGGIILFLASKKNENRGNELTVLNLKMEKKTIYTLSRAYDFYFPALSLSIRIR
jgi:hypothetical protein